MQAIPPIATHSVVCMSVVCHSGASCLNRSTVLDAICRQVGYSDGSNDTLCQMGVPDIRGEGEIWGWTPTQNMQLQIADTPGE